MKKIVITGATGMLGRKISSKLIEEGYSVTILSRDSIHAKSLIPGAEEYVSWNYKSDDWYQILDGKYAVIHLAGENIIAKRWTLKRKEKIIASRVESTKALIRAIKKVEHKPEVFISASAVGYYGNSEQEVEETSPPGNDFLSHVVKSWEDSSLNISNSVRRVVIRIGVVLDKEHGALAKMLTPFKYFIGGSLGAGKQWFPWIHINDVVSIFLYALKHSDIAGIFNASSPNPVRMKLFCKTLGQVMKRPSFATVPAFILRVLFGEAADTILTGAKVIPKRTKEHGYEFLYSDLESALRNLLD